MEFLTRLGIDPETLPTWLAASLPTILQGLQVLGAVILVWTISVLIKSIVRRLGRRFHHGETDFDGSSWDMGAIISQLATVIMLAPLPLTLAGLDAFSFFETYASGAIAAATTIALAIVLSSWLSGSIRKFGAKANQRTGADDTLFGFIASMVKYAIFAVALVLALTQLGFDATSLVALVGAAGLAIGLALQDTLKAVAGGVMLAVFRPLHKGDWVNLSGHEGEVFEVTPFQTAIRAVDNRVITFTNDRVWSEPLVNYTREKQRRLDLYFGVSYDDDLDQALGVLMRLVNDHPSVIRKDANWAGVHALGDSSVDLRLRAWVPTSEFLQTRADLTKSVKEAFDAAGITIPYPHQVEIQYQGKAPTSSAEAVIPPAERMSEDGGGD